jgi:AcrR family transcriptional regulator
MYGLAVVSQGVRMLGTIASKGRGASERILETGADLFSRFGYNGVSTRDIATAANVNEVTIYRHYPRKRDLYIAVLESELRQVHLSGDMLANIAEATDGRMALERAFELVSKTMSHRPKMLRLVSFGVLELHEDFDPLVRRHLGELIDVIARYLEPWIEKGDLRCTHAKAAILTLISIVMGHDSLQRVFLGKPIEPEHMYAAYSDLAFAGPPGANPPPASRPAGEAIPSGSEGR